MLFSLKTRKLDKTDGSVNKVIKNARGPSKKIDPVLT